MLILSEYARYLPSGDIAEAMIQISLALVVKRRNVTGACDDLDLTARRQRNHPPPIPATTRMANSAPTNCHFRVQGSEALVGCTLVGIGPGSVSCSGRLRSDRADRVAAGFSTLPMKRYPRRATVSTKIGLSADSPRASRNLWMAALRL
jgi:hypothetical protein